MAKNPEDLESVRKYQAKEQGREKRRVIIANVLSQKISVPEGVAELAKNGLLPNHNLS